MDVNNTKKLEPSSLASQAYERLLSEIADGHFEDNERLVIDDIARQYGTSLIPVREALARLNAQRLVEYVKNKGYRVAPKLTYRDYEDIFEARMMIECSSIEFGGHRVKPEQITKLEELNQQLHDLKLGTTYETYRDFVEINDQFHRLLVEIADNRLIAQAFDDLSYGKRVSRGLSGIGILDLEEDVQEHNVIIAALKNGEPNTAKQAVKEHIQQGRERFLASIEP